MKKQRKLRTIDGKGFTATQEDFHKKSVVYKMTFQDHSIYIGSTTRALNLRLDEHRSHAMRNHAISHSAKRIKFEMLNNRDIKVEVIMQVDDPKLLHEVEKSHIREAHKHGTVINTLSIH